VVTALAGREQRMHHLLWQEIRRFWLQYPRDVQDRIRELGWEPPRPSRDENELPLAFNNSGQDFFYMRRQLNLLVNRLLAAVGDPDYPLVEGWTQLPAPRDPDFPVPPAWFDPGAHPVRTRYLARIKTDAVFEKSLRYWERTFSDPVYLRSVSLGELGARVEYYLFDPFRRRWAAAPGATRPEPTPDQAAAIETVWDAPRYDYLGDYYSMHVNPVYWRFSGWLEDRLEEWKTANGVFGNDFWTGTWVGKMPADPPVAARQFPPGPSATAQEFPPGPSATAVTAAATEMEELVSLIAGRGSGTSPRPDDQGLLDVLEPGAPTGGGPRPEPPSGDGGHH
jgi:hypothetical protein